ncbi:MAG TPA: thiamine pyrophosphate-binding protein, partial [Phycisphaeraceae bacterium]
MENESLSAVQLLVRYLEGEGVEYIFGIPGGPLMPLYEAIFDNGRIRPIITKHEEGAAFMADGYARVRGGLGVCCATTGPGATNALTGVACARLDSIPLMVLTAQVAISAFGKGAAQESSVQGLDVVELYRSATKASLMLLSAAKTAETVQSLLRKALTGRPGPVHLNLPADLAKRKATPWSGRPPKEYRTQPLCFDRQAVKAACNLLIHARRPAILAGHGVYLSRAWQELIRLAQRLGIPVATTPKGKGVFPEDHVLSLGVLGFAGSPQA